MTRLYLAPLLSAAVLLGGCSAPSPPAPGPATSPEPAASSPSHCGQPATTEDTGRQLSTSWTDLVTALHDAACRYDYDKLRERLDPEVMSDYGDRTPRDDLIANWRERDTMGIYLDLLAASLETIPHIAQGGLYFRHDGAVVILSRGTRDIPSALSAFVSKCSTSPLAQMDMC